MVVSCCVLSCTSKQYKGSMDPTLKLTFHRFPLHRKSLCDRWVFAVRRGNWYPNANSRICTKHFLESDYKDGKLKPNAVPSVFGSKIRPEVFKPKLVLCGSESDQQKLVLCRSEAELQKFQEVKFKEQSSNKPIRETQIEFESFEEQSIKTEPCDEEPIDIELLVEQSIRAEPIKLEQEEVIIEPEDNPFNCEVDIKKEREKRDLEPAKTASNPKPTVFVYKLPKKKKQDEKDAEPSKKAINSKPNVILYKVPKRKRTDDINIEPAEVVSNSRPTVFVYKKKKVNKEIDIEPVEVIDAPKAPVLRHKEVLKKKVEEDKIDLEPEEKIEDSKVAAVRHKEAPKKRVEEDAAAGMVCLPEAKESPCNCSLATEKRLLGEIVVLQQQLKHKTQIIRNLTLELEKVHNKLDRLLNKES